MASTRRHPDFTIAEVAHRSSETAQVIAPEALTLAVAKRVFKTQSAYKQCEPINKFIKVNYPRPARDAKERDAQSPRTVYLDYGAAGLPMHTVLREEHKLFMTSVLGNPHSANPSSKLSTKYTDLARAAALSYFGTTSATHECVWTSGTSNALTMLRNLYFEDVRRKQVRTRVLILDDVHHSVNGIRTVADEDGLKGLITVTFVPIDAVTLRVDEEIFNDEINALQADERGLVLFTAQSNLSGVVHDFTLLKAAKARGWHTLLDAACYCPTSVLDLTLHDYIDFVPVSWYKVVGHPTGLGSLIIKQSALKYLSKSYFAGGTVATISNNSPSAFSLHPTGFAALEDGTINFRSFPALYFGLSKLLSVPRPLISQRTKLLLTWLIAHIVPLRHISGHPVVRVVGFPSSDLATLQKKHGSTISVVFYQADGKKVASRYTEEAALRAGLEIRKGRMCNTSARVANPGTDDWFGEHPDELARHDWIWHANSSNSGDDADVKARVSCHDGEWRLERLSDEQIGDGSHLTKYGVSRVSLGLPTRFEDVYAFYDFAHKQIERSTSLASPTVTAASSLEKLISAVGISKRHSLRPKVMNRKGSETSDTLVDSSAASSLSSR